LPTVVNKKTPAKLQGGDVNILI